MGLIRRIKRRSNRRYRLYVPKDIRRLGEAAGAPKPNRFVPSAQSAPPMIIERYKRYVEFVKQRRKHR
jgi:hypothetical protein